MATVLLRIAGPLIGVLGLCAGAIGVAYLREPQSSLTCDRATGRCEYVQARLFGRRWMQSLPISELHDSRMVIGPRDNLHQWRVSQLGHADIDLTDWLDDQDGLAMEQGAIELEHFLVLSEPPTFHATMNEVTPGPLFIAAGGLLVVLGALVLWRTRAGVDLTRSG